MRPECNIILFPCEDSTISHEFRTTGKLRSVTKAADPIAVHSTQTTRSKSSYRSNNDSTTWSTHPNSRYRKRFAVLSFLACGRQSILFVPRRQFWYSHRFCPIYNWLRIFSLLPNLRNDATVFFQCCFFVLPSHESCNPRRILVSMYCQILISSFPNIYIYIHNLP